MKYIIMGCLVTFMLWNSTEQASAQMRIAGSVTLLPTSQPAQPVVYLLNAEGPLSSVLDAAIVDAEGHYAFLDVAEGRYRIRISYVQPVGRYVLEYSVDTAPFMAAHEAISMDFALPRIPERGRLVEALAASSGGLSAIKEPLALDELQPPLVRSAALPQLGIDEVRVAVRSGY